MSVAIKVIARVLLPVGVVAVGLLSLIPPDAVPVVNLWDKLAHFLAYAMLALCGGFAFSAHRTEIALGALLIGCGCILEIAQIYIPGRSGSIADAIANGLGVVAGMVIVQFLRRRFTKPVVGV